MEGPQVKARGIDVGRRRRFPAGAAKERKLKWGVATPPGLFVSVASKGVTGRVFVSVASKGVEGGQFRLISAKTRSSAVSVASKELSGRAVDH